MIPQPHSSEASTSSRESNARKASVQSLPKPPSTFTYRGGRRYHGDESIHYFLPCDVQELSRQSLFHELQREVYGGYHCAEFPDDAIPSKVLEIGCGTAIWSASVADSFAARGRPDVQFVGLDIVPVYPNMQGVNFTFVQHNFQNLPLPFPDGEFDYVICREISMATPVSGIYGSQITDCVRVLKPGGTLELQCSDYSIRSLQRTTVPFVPGSGAYIMTPATQFSMSAENPFLAAWNERITKVLTKYQLSPVPCTLAGPQLLMEEGIIGVHSKRVALPLDEIWWESSPNSDGPRRKRTSIESTGTVDSKNRKDSLSVHRRSSTSVGSNQSQSLHSPLSNDEKAVRELARLTFVQLIESLESILRETNNIAIDDWDRWYKDLMVNFFQHGGLQGGECVEFGSWWGQKASKE
ncbi:hypothetical protein L873DRAFT_1673836 [Choiromyces venosus 120613-1]|uniref:Methyltransferase domain-containing protein n=1 Tax=Choiromyces venosus 120613-1 TaxID=1336337 RepID=A0A3N4JVC7_9PEZI|nr:hypothetical protein L873DRAFT_1673836 [Choiromyces venosus 120613-1]